MQKQPFISCLCVTHNKPLMLQRVINCFRNQSYRYKQLVIVYEESDELTVGFLHGQIWEESIKLVKVSDKPVKLPLGKLRNLSLEEADGDYVCQWDDDDWYDPDRLSIQMEAILKADRPASILFQWVVFDAVASKAYLSGRRLWEGSILCRKDILLNRPYPEISKGEDTEVIESLVRKNLLTVIHDMPELYIYIYHGANTWEQDHFTDIFAASTELSPEECAQVIDILNDC